MDKSASISSKQSIRDSIFGHREQELVFIIVKEFLFFFSRLSMLSAMFKTPSSDPPDEPQLMPGDSYSLLSRGAALPRDAINDAASGLAGSDPIRDEKENDPSVSDNGPVSSDPRTTPAIISPESSSGTDLSDDLDLLTALAWSGRMPLQSSLGSWMSNISPLCSSSNLTLLLISLCVCFSLYDKFCRT